MKQLNIVEASKLAEHKCKGVNIKPSNTLDRKLGRRIFIIEKGAFCVELRSFH